tara:strand:+ start:426 stop:578 length:153 start_codon:yes stop_codon:yes gene_type:complete
MSISKQMMMEEMESIEREEYDEDGNPKDGYEDLDNIEIVKETKKGEKNDG